MRGFLTTALLLTALATASADAATPGPVCRQECAPRIAQDCGVPGDRGFRKCKRKLVKQCKATTPEVACALGSNPGGGPGGDPGTGPRGDLAARVTAALANKLVSSGSSELFDGGLGSITQTDDMTLCGSGQVQLVVTRITSTSIGSTDSEERFEGTWTVRVESGAALLELEVGEPDPLRFAIEVDASGAVFVDGSEATVDDASGVCGVADPGNGGTPGGGPEDVVQQITEAFRDRVFVLVETNAGFGRRVTAMVLCASGRYALEVDSAAAPGVEVSAQGDWAIRLETDVAVLELAGEGGQPTRSFVIGEDAQGNLLLGNVVAQAGDTSLVAETCPGL